MLTDRLPAPPRAGTSNRAVSNCFGKPFLSSVGLIARNFDTDSIHGYVALA